MRNFSFKQSNTKIMKTKIITLSFFMLTFFTLAFSQTGSVGINTASPTRTFDVNGDVRFRVIRDTLDSNLKYLVVDDSGNVYKTSLAPGNYAVDTCPPGFVSVNDEYCIEPNERPAVTWWVAVATCGSLNAHLCKWDEWYFAATNAVSLGLTNLTGAWEWVGDGAGGGTAKTVGLNTIDESLSNLPTFLNNFRCCKSK